MTHQKTIPANQLPRILHIGLRDAYSWETPDFPPELTGGDGLIVECHLWSTNRPNPLEKPRWAASTTHLYSQEITLPIPEFNPIEKRIEAVEKELGEISEQYHRRKAELLEQRQNILALAAPEPEREDPNE